MATAFYGKGIQKFLEGKINWLDDTIKVVGVNEDGFVHAITHIARQFDPAFDAATIELRDSRAGNYLGVTITITATSREQLDGLYRALSSHPLVKVVL